MHQPAFDSSCALDTSEADSLWQTDSFGQNRFIKTIHSVITENTFRVR